jgi:hypothetical protein
VGPAGIPARRPRRVLAQARLDDVADDHLVDLLGGGVGPPEGLADGDGAQLGGRHVRQAAQVLADGGPHG